MKGFLQRMAANAVRPQSGIHPLVGSIYGGLTTGKPPGGAKEELEEERLVLNSKPVADESNDNVDDSGAPVSGIRGKGRDGRQGVQRADSRPEARSMALQAMSFRPLIAKTNVQSAGSGRYGTAADTQRSDRFDTDSDRGELSRPGELRSGPALFEPRNAFAIHPGYRGKPNAFSHSVPVEREPDKVEIHIGRIEVTAVPPEAPRPIEPRPRKSLNLSEYLKRRDGRTG